MKTKSMKKVIAAVLVGIMTLSGSLAVSAAEIAEQETAAEEITAEELAAEEAAEETTAEAIIEEAAEEVDAVDAEAERAVGEERELGEYTAMIGDSLRMIYLRDLGGGLADGTYKEKIKITSTSGEGDAAGERTLFDNVSMEVKDGYGELRYPKGLEKAIGTAYGRRLAASIPVNMSETYVITAEGDLNFAVGRVRVSCMNSVKNVKMLDIDTDGVYRSSSEGEEFSVQRRDTMFTHDSRSGLVDELWIGTVDDAPAPTEYVLDVYSFADGAAAASVTVNGSSGRVGVDVHEAFGDKIDISTPYYLIAYDKADRTRRSKALPVYLDVEGPRIQVDDANRRKIPKLNYSELSILNGRAVKLKVLNTKIDSQVSVKAEYWNNENPDIVQVSRTGKVTPLATGTARILALVNDTKTGTRIANLECIITVEKPSLANNKREKIVMGADEPETLTVSMNGLLPGSDPVVWKSSRESVALVDGDGTVTPVKAGKTVVSAVRNGKKYKVMVSVYNPTLVVPGDGIVKVGKRLSLKVKYGAGQTVFTSSDTSVATVDGRGRVRGIAKGTAIITAVNSGKTMQREITVE